jgi:hypothetical protein
MGLEAEFRGRADALVYEKDWGYRDGAMMKAAVSLGLPYKIISEICPCEATENKSSSEQVLARRNGRRKPKSRKRGKLRTLTKKRNATESELKQ